MFEEGAEEVFVKVDGTLCEFSLEYVEESFDGFDTVFPACVALVPTKESDNG